MSQFAPARTGDGPPACGCTRRAARIRRGRTCSGPRRHCRRLRAPLPQPGCSHAEPVPARRTVAAQRTAARSGSDRSQRMASSSTRCATRHEESRPLLPAASAPKSRPLNLLPMPGSSGASNGRGDDSNQRPLALQGPSGAVQGSSDLRKSSEPFGVQPEAPVQGSQGSTTIRRNFATNLLPPIEQLLTVRQVAQVFGLSTAMSTNGPSPGCSHTSASSMSSVSDPQM